MPPDAGSPESRPQPHATAGAAGLPVLIAGGGIAGIATALALARTGRRSHVLESRAEPPHEGAGIQLGPNGVRILTDLGVAPVLAPLAGVPDDIRVVEGSSGSVLAALPLGHWIEKRHGAPYWVAHRSDLHAALLAAARAEPSITIGMGQGVETAAASRDGAVSVTTSTGARHDGCALIAADGIWSGLRAAHFDATLPHFEQKSAARTLIPRERAPAPLAANATFAWLSPGAHVVHYPVRGGREIAVVVVRSEMTASRDWNADVASAWVEEAARTFHASLRELLAAGTGWRKWSLHSHPGVRRLATGAMALVGDAAHPVLPFLAQGGVMALEDAVVLAGELRRTPDDIPAALARYAEARHARVTRVAAASRRNGGIYHLDGLSAFARNAAIRALGGRRIMEGYDWLYGWRAGSDDVRSARTRA